VQPSIVQMICRVLRAVRDSFGTAILFVEQNLDTILALAERGYVMEKGHVVAQPKRGDVSQGNIRRHLLLQQRRLKHEASRFSSRSADGRTAPGRSVGLARPADTGC